MTTKWTIIFWLSKGIGKFPHPTATFTFSIFTPNLRRHPTITIFFLFKGGVQIKDYVQDLSAEGIAIGCLYSNPDLFLEYAERIFPERDFNDKTCRFLYNILHQCFITQGQLNDIALNVYTRSIPASDLERYNELGGTAVFHKFARIAQNAVGDFKKVFTTLKNYSTMRSLQGIDIDIIPYLDKFKDKTPDYITNVYEQALAKISLYNQGEESPELLNKGIRSFAAEIRSSPDIGIPLPLPIISTAIRGLKRGTITGLFAHTNKGKTRLLTNILTDISVKNKIRTMFISTEQTDKEMKLQYLTSIWNNIIASSEDEEIQETALATMQLDEKQEKMLEDTVSYFENNCELYFKCVSSYDLTTIKRYMKLADLKGCELVCIDVLKPCRQKANAKMSEWQEFAATVEAIRNLALELNLAVVFTAHLNTQSATNGELDISSIANGTQIAFVCDVCLMFRDISLEEKMKYSVCLTIPDSPFNGAQQALMIEKNYMLAKLVKNRFGNAGDEIVLEVEKGKNKFSELGFLTRSQAKT